MRSRVQFSVFQAPTGTAEIFVPTLQEEIAIGSRTTLYEVLT
jgi:hypothetical protein